MKIQSKTYLKSTINSHYFPNFRACGATGKQTTMIKTNLNRTQVLGLCKNPPKYKSTIKSIFPQHCARLRFDYYQATPLKIFLKRTRVRLWPLRSVTFKNFLPTRPRRSKQSLIQFIWEKQIYTKCWYIIIYQHMVYIDQTNPAAGGKILKYIPIYGIWQKYIHMYTVCWYISMIYTSPKSLKRSLVQSWAATAGSALQSWKNGSAGLNCGSARFESSKGQKEHMGSSQRRSGPKIALS